jgi:hypothetical protein
MRNTRNYTYFTQDILAEEWKNHLLVTIVAKKNIQLDVARNIHMHITMHAHVKKKEKKQSMPIWVYTDAHAKLGTTTCMW